MVKIKTEVIKESDKSIRKAIIILKKGGLVVFPTETAYGIAADATSSRAIKKIYEVKKRSREKSVSIIVSSLKMMARSGIITKEIRYLVKEFMPGPLTLVIKKKNSLPQILSREGVAFRIPSNKNALRIIRIFGKPITATSANLSGQPPLYKTDEVIKTFDGKVEMILDGGNLKIIRPSTIVSFLDNNKPKILRKGSISNTKILRKLQKFKK